MATFKASARSVDMLGRQQIAGIPNALNELFKNAYDAYATECRVDYIEEANILFIRDNGYGMTREDFENRWLILGTDSKSVKQNFYIPEGGNRSILGEKGIGRLAIATIGTSVLIVSRANKNNNISKIITSYVCWPLFEIPGISIDQIPVPIIETDTMPSDEEVNNLITQTEDFYKKLLSERKEQISGLLRAKIEETFSHRNISPKQLSHQYKNFENTGKVSNLHLDDNLSGTHFYIFPVEKEISILLESNSLYTKDLNDCVKQLLGFYPTFIKDLKPAMETSFNIYRKNELYPVNLISDNEFFSPSDYAKADHHFEGRFDKRGTFKGTISIYGKKIDYSIPCSDSYNQNPKCGPFNIQIAYFQGRQDESSLSPEDFPIMKQKLDRIGGLYIYKNNVRVLPYGDNDYDFLKLEKLRTLSASRYPFSLRRFIGAIFLTNDENIGLQEKAGREGFSKNQAYYDFISILQNFLENVESNFLREDSNRKQSEIYFEIKSALRRQYWIQKNEEMKNQYNQNSFEKELTEKNKKLQELQKNNPLNQYESRITSVVLQNDLLTSQDELIRSLNEIKNNILEEIRKVENNLLIIEPKFALDENLFLKYKRYQNELSLFFEKNLYLKRNKCLQDITNSLIRLTSKKEEHSRLNKEKDVYISEIHSYLNDKEKQLKQEIINLSSLPAQWNDKIKEHYSIDMNSISKDISIESLSADKIVELIDKYEKNNLQYKAEISRFYDFIEDDIHNIQHLDPYNEKAYTNKEALIAQEESLLELKKQLENEYELFQLGTAISIIHHEFSSTADSIKSSIKNLGVWANANPSLRPLYNKLDISYRHLENYLQLFTPLSRRIKTVKTEILGNEIYKYVKDLFREKCKTNDVSIIQTNTFKKSLITIDTAVIIPVFVNIVDNSLFWLKSTPIEEDRSIQFDYINEVIYIYDNGPGFLSLSEELIFSRGFTTKPGGRGLGLFISKQILNSCGFEIEATQSIYSHGAGFKISKLIKEEKNA